MYLRVNILMNWNLEVRKSSRDHFFRIHHVRVRATILGHRNSDFFEKKVPDGPNLPSKYFVYEIVLFVKKNF